VPFWSALPFLEHVALRVPFFFDLDDDVDDEPFHLPAVYLPLDSDLVCNSL
jgi:hypothetical protein